MSKNFTCNLILVHFLRNSLLILYPFPVSLSGWLFIYLNTHKVYHYHTRWVDTLSYLLVIFLLNSTTSLYWVLSNRYVPSLRPKSRSCCCCILSVVHSTVHRKLHEVGDNNFILSFTWQRIFAHDFLFLCGLFSSLG